MTGHERAGQVRVLQLSMQENKSRGSGVHCAHWLSFPDPHSVELTARHLNNSPTALCSKTPLTGCLNCSCRRLHSVELWVPSTCPLLGKSSGPSAVSICLKVKNNNNNNQGLPRWLSGKESACQCRRPRFDPWVRKIPWRRKRQPTPVFLPGESHGQRSLVGYSPGGPQRVEHD